MKRKRSIERDKRKQPVAAAWHTQVVKILNPTRKFNPKVIAFYNLSKRMLNSSHSLKMREFHALERDFI